jgi:hypothetical protein
MPVMPWFRDAFSRASSALRARGGREAEAAGRCGACAHFRNDAAYLESAIPGYSSLSSASASVRADDGLCLRRDRYLSARAGCADFSARDNNAAARIAAPIPAR